MNELVAGIAGDRGQIGAVAGVAQLVEVDHGFVRLRQPVKDEIRADEAGAACNQNRHVLVRCSASSLAYLLKLFMQPMAMCTSPA